jgi:hypothetical protein
MFYIDMEKVSFYFTYVMTQVLLWKGLYTLFAGFFGDTHMILDGLIKIVISFTGVCVLLLAGYLTVVMDERIEKQGLL